MSTRSSMATAVVAVVALLGAVGTVDADCEAWPPGHGFRQVLSRLDVTPEQEASIREILYGERATLAPLRDAAVSARRALAEATHAASLDEAAVRGAAERAARAQADLAVERARLRARLRAVLTADQVRRLDEARGRMRERMERRLRMRQHMGNDWLD